MHILYGVTYCVLLCHIYMADARSWERADEQELQNFRTDPRDIVPQDANKYMDVAWYGKDTVTEEHSDPTLVSGEFARRPTLDNSPQKVIRKKWWPIENKQFDDRKQEPKYFKPLDETENSTPKEEEKKERISVWQREEPTKRETIQTNMDKRSPETVTKKIPTEYAPNKPWYEEKGPVTPSTSKPIPTYDRIVDSSSKALPNNNFHQPDKQYVPLSQNAGREEKNKPTVEQTQKTPTIEKRSWNQQYGNPFPPAMYPPSVNQQRYIPQYTPPNVNRGNNGPMRQNIPLPPYRPNPPMMMPRNNPPPTQNYYNPPNMNGGPMDQGNSWQPRPGWMPEAMRPYARRFNSRSNKNPQSEDYDTFEQAWHKYIKEFRQLRGEEFGNRKVTFDTHDAPCDPALSFCDRDKKAYYFKDFKSKGQRQSELGRILGSDYSSFIGSNRWFIKNTLKNIADAFVKGIEVLTGRRPLYN